MPADVLIPLLDLPGVADAAESARSAVDRLLGHRVLRASSATVSAEAALRSARASAALEDVEVGLAELRAGTVGDPVAQGALRIAGELGRLVETWRRAPLQVLARLHVLAATGSQPADELGRPTADEVTSARLDGLARVLTGGSAVPTVLVAAVVHGELHTLVPFRTGSGVVARAAARLTGIVGGLDPKALSVPEVGHLALREEYADAASAYAEGDAGGVARWLRHCCAAQELGAREGLAICEAVLRG
ncbi:MAG: oxidoreductase [Actinobacteria bacterium]|nr:oxidoreductase [Actinomycetota bacterium]MBI3686374.1 oxidoreductase [Actinomycetota bacterium]